MHISQRLMDMFRKHLTALLFLSAFAGLGQAVPADSLFAELLPVLKRSGQDSRTMMSEAERVAASTTFDSALALVVEYPEAMRYDFPDVSNLSILTSRDKRVRLLTWMVPLAGGQYAHHGYLLINKDKEYQAIKLKDNAASAGNPAYLLLKPEQWYGGLYYDILERSVDGQKVYVLLGYRSVNPRVQQKFIDALTMDNGLIRFGAQIFETPVFNDVEYRQRPYRITMSYAAGRSALLHWNDDYGGIVMDHVSPPDISQKGFYMVYGPDLSYDALVWKDEKWHLESNVTFRSNIETPQPEREPEMGLSPGGR